MASWEVSVNMRNGGVICGNEKRDQGKSIYYMNALEIKHNLIWVLVMGLVSHKQLRIALYDLFRAFPWISWNML